MLVRIEIWFVEYVEEEKGVGISFEREIRKRNRKGLRVTFHIFVISLSIEAGKLL
jgi:hypothetical protein